MKISDCSTALPTEKDVRVELIRSLSSAVLFKELLYCTLAQVALLLHEAGDKISMRVL